MRTGSQVGIKGLHRHNAVAEVVLRKSAEAIGSAISVLALLLSPLGPANAHEGSYPSMAPLEQYRMSRPDEVALARSAAPASISNDADVLVLGDRGYETAEKGKNGFVCFVGRSWSKGFDDHEFWNFKIRSPQCFNPAAARSVLPAYLERTQWVLTGLPKATLIERTKASAAAKEAPAPGSIAYMMSKQGYLDDDDGPWHSHVMFFVPGTDAAAWGAGLPGSPVLAVPGDIQPMTVLLVTVRKWSDGTQAPIAAHH